MALDDHTVLKLDHAFSNYQNNGMKQIEVSWLEFRSLITNYDFYLYNLRPLLLLLIFVLVALPLI